MPTIRQIFDIGDGELDEIETDKLISRYNRYQKLKTYAKDKAEEEFYLKNERIKIQLEINEDIPSQEYEQRRKLEEQLKEIKSQKALNYAGFITINPKEQSIEILEQLKKLCEKCVSKYWVGEYAYCFEQRSDDPSNYKGIHAHMLIKRDIKPSHFEREIRSTFKGIVEIPSKHIHISWKKKEWIADKIEYMNGNKTGEGKDLKTKIDSNMRKEYDLETIYSSPTAFGM